ncbi:MAG: hypothetical protein AAF575_01750 [Bacteroidota bacterium]|nr:hypothetical protein [uncultured Allomuricauda sp.]
MALLSNIQKDFIKNSNGYASLGIVLSTCLGGVAILYAFGLNDLRISMFLAMVTVIVCSMHNAAILTVQKPLMIYRLLVASTVINILIIIGSALFG